MSQSNTVTQWRNYFESSGDNSTTYKLFIETAYGCHGSCHGCPIPIIARNSREPKWELNQLEENLSAFATHLVQWRIDQNLPPIENLAITVGPGENMFFSPEYLQQLATVAKNFKNRIGAKHFHLAVSTSGLFAETKLEEKIRSMKSVLNDNELTFAFIINLRQFQRTPMHYYRFAELLMQHINLVELEINMDADLGTITPDVLDNFSTFVKSFPFIQLDFAYAINDGNVTTTYMQDEQFYHFINSLRQLSEASTKEHFSEWHTKLNPIPSEDFDFYSNFQGAYSNIIQNSIRLNSLGQWHFAKNILGTVYYDENLGFEPLATHKENPFSQIRLHHFKNSLSKFFHKQLASHTPCNNCQWKNTCLHSGFLTYTKFANQNESVCTNPAFTIFQHK